MFNKGIAIIIVFLGLSITSCSKNESFNFFIKKNIAAQNISFSIQINNNVGHLTMFDKEDLVLLIREYLQRTGRYKEITYRTIDQKKPRHLHFRLIVTRTKDSDQPIWGAISRLTLLTIPRAIQYYSDFTVFSFLNDNEIFSATIANKFNAIIWLPLIVLNPVVNDYVISKLVLKLQLPALLKEINKNSNEYAQ